MRHCQYAPFDLSQIPQSAWQPFYIEPFSRIVHGFLQLQCDIAARSFISLSSRYLPPPPHGKYSHLFMLFPSPKSTCTRKVFHTINASIILASGCVKFHTDPLTRSKFRFANKSDLIFFKNEFKRHTKIPTTEVFSTVKVAIPLNSLHTFPIAPEVVSI